MFIIWRHFHKFLPAAAGFKPKIKMSAKTTMLLLLSLLWKLWASLKEGECYNNYATAAVPALKTLSSLERKVSAITSMPLLLSLLWRLWAALKGRRVEIATGPNHLDWQENWQKMKKFFAAKFQPKKMKFVKKSIPHFPRNFSKIKDRYSFCWNNFSFFAFFKIQILIYLYFMFSWFWKQRHYLFINLDPQNIRSYKTFSTLIKVFLIKAHALPRFLIKTSSSLHPRFRAWHFNYFCK